MAQVLYRGQLEAMGVESVTVASDRTSRGYASTKTVKVADVRRLVMKGAEKGVLHFTNRKKQQDWKQEGRITLNRLPYKQEPSAMLHVKPGLMLKGEELEAEHVLQVEMGVVDDPMPKEFGGQTIGSFTWIPFPIREVETLLFSSSSREGHGVLTLKPGFGRPFHNVSGQIRLYRPGGKQLEFTYGDPPVVITQPQPEFVHQAIALGKGNLEEGGVVNIGAAVNAAASQAAGGVEFPTGSVLHRDVLIGNGATHVDLTPRGQDGELKTTRSIEVDKISEVLLGEHGYVVLRESTAQLHGDVRVKVRNMSRRLGEAAEQIAGSRTPRGDEIAYHQGENKALRHVGQLLGIAGPCTYQAVTRYLQELIYQRERRAKEQEAIFSAKTGDVLEFERKGQDPVRLRVGVRPGPAPVTHDPALDELVRNGIIRLPHVIDHEQVIFRRKADSASAHKDVHDMIARVAVLYADHVRGTSSPAPSPTIGFNCAGKPRPADLDAAAQSMESVPGGFAVQVTATVRNRGSDYGHPSTNHQLTADMWNGYLSRRLGMDVKMSAEDVCMLNVLQKASRLADGTKDDSWLDIAGYTENVGMLRKDQRNTRK